MFDAPILRKGAIYAKAGERLYRPIDEILATIQETATINQILKPVYNYKAGSQ
ncbi:MAG: hypothetical protein II312_05720 [Lachnospiraceae bacterium]|nr:hypothetical protein [Lachnospiraceae bacterium]MBQ2406153.1 hypothetical protein [Lachnospiraceae bacterium]